MSKHTTAQVEKRFEELTDEQDAAAVALAEHRYGVGLQGLAEGDPDECWALLDEVQGRPLRTEDGAVHVPGWLI